VKCNQSDCLSEAAHRFTWPGRDEEGICEAHLPKLKQVVANLDMHLQIRPIERPARPPCGRCDGCGQIADSKDGEPWTAWTSLPPGSDIAVRMGLVKPIPCPSCNVPAEQSA
jgi:hypothetical protein